MIDKGLLKQMCLEINRNTWFDLAMIEKDYYITEFFRELQNCQDVWLMFKGWTCLNKVYLWYYRLSEDIDFSVYRKKLKELDWLSNNQQEKERRKIWEEIKKVIDDCFVHKLWLTEVPFKDKSWAINFLFNKAKMLKLFYKYESVFDNNQTNTIQMEITMMGLPKEEPNLLKVNHLFHIWWEDFFNEEIYTSCYNINEVVSEKLRCSFWRFKKDVDNNPVVKIAIRDLFDLYYMGFRQQELIDRWFFWWEDDKFLELFLQKNLSDIINKWAKTKDYSIHYHWEELTENFPEDIQYALNEIEQQHWDLHIVSNNETSADFLRRNNVRTTIYFVGLQQENLKKYIKRKYKDNQTIQNLNLEDHLETYLNAII